MAGRAYTDAELKVVVENLAHRMGITSGDDLYNTIGFGGLSVSRISGKLKDEFERVVKAPEPEATDESIAAKAVSSPKNIRRGSGVVVDGQHGCQVKFARCCNPLPGDDILGFVTRGFGISIHKRDCPNAIAGVQNPDQKERWMVARWEGEAAEGPGGLYEAVLKLYLEERIGVLAEITAAIADMKVSILQINTQNTQKGIAMNLTVGCKNVNHYNAIVSRIRGIRSVLSVERGIKGGN